MENNTKTFYRPSYWQRLKIAFQFLMPQFGLTRLAGFFASKRLGFITQLAIKLFIKKYKVNMEEADYPTPSAYKTFNEFFTRKLKVGAREVSEKTTALCCPADGKISEFGKIQEGQLLQAKGHSFLLPELLAGDENLAAKFNSGNFLTIYLSPKDYHRVHIPCKATLKKMTYVPGELFSVNPFLGQHISNLFARNERVICEFETDFGPMIQILVGATITASITTTWAGVITPPRLNETQSWEYRTDVETAEVFDKGDEMGAFQLGSTVITLFPNELNLNFAPEIKAGSAVEMGTDFAEYTLK